MVIVIVAIVLIALVVGALVLARQRRSQQLQEGFGPEYERTVSERGDRKQGEAELLERRKRHDRFEIRDLDPAARDRYADRWRSAQRRFVDEPGPAVGEADALVMEVMRDRGYPVADEFEQRAADVSVDHPQVVEHYRAAHHISGRATTSEASTEDLRQAMVHFRALFVELLGDAAEPADRDTAPSRDTAAGGPRTTRTENVREMR
jgi:FtsZ-interacting cell division protein ZipA